MIFILDRNENIINILRNNGEADNASPFFDDILREELVSGSETFQFTTISNGKIATDVKIGNYVAFKKNGKFKLFQIMETEETHEEEVYLTAYCECAGLELSNKIFRGVVHNSISLENFLTTALEDTSWSAGFVDATLLANTISLNLEDTTVYSALQNVIPQFEGELEFRVEIENGKIKNKYVDIYKTRGKVTGKRFTFGRDIEGITRRMDSTKLCTALIGKGKGGIDFKSVTLDGINKPLGQDFVADEISFSKYNNKGYHVMGIYKCEAETPEELLMQTYKALQECKEPRYEYDITIALAEKILGETWNEVSIGDTVSILDHSFYPPVQLMARVSVLETSFTNPDSNSCTLSNFIEVKSNITDEMRKIASQLEGYVDSRFPITENDISDGAVTQDKINDSYTSKITADIVEAGKIVTEKLIAKEAEITNAKIQEAVIGKAEIEELEATIAVIETLKATLASIETLLAGNITSGNIQAGGITSDRLTIADGFIKNAMIDSLNASKINAGNINTNNVSISSENGAIQIADGTQQFRDSNGNLRIQMGQDSDGNFNFVIYDETGQGVLIDSTGIKESAIEDGLIKNEMIGTGEIGGDKIDINSMITEINENGDKLISGSKVLLDSKGQSLEIAFNNISSTTQEIKNDIDEINANKMYRVEIISSNGNIFKNGNINTILSARLYSWDKNITDEVNASRFRWTRISSDIEGDKAWNTSHAGGTKEIEITSNDVYARATFECVVLDEQGKIMAR